MMVDRFHDDHDRKPLKSEGKTSGFGNTTQLKKNCGGTLRGITNHLNYIKDLGCPALWLSPVFQNNEESYHGYAIEDYTTIDKRFGTNEGLAKLVASAHDRDMRVFSPDGKHFNFRSIQTVCWPFQEFCMMKKY